MSHKKCCVPGCLESGDSHKVLHGFPNPVKERERFNEWIKTIGGDILCLEDEYIYKQRRVCHSHFVEKHCCRWNRISNTAIPTLKLPGLSSVLKYALCEKNHIRPKKSSTPKDVPVCVSPELYFDTPSIESDGKKKEQEKERNKQIKDNIDERIDTEEDRISSTCSIDAEQNFECWRYKLTNIFDSAKFCGFCAENDEGMLPVHEYLDIGVKELNLKKSWSEIVQEVFHGTDVLLSKYICEKCSEKLIQAYLFIHTTKRVAKIMTDYINNFHSKMIPLTSHLFENPDVHSRVFIILDNDDAGDFNPEILSTEYAAKLNSVDHNGDDEENKKSELLSKLSEVVVKTCDDKEKKNDNELHKIAADDILDENLDVDENNDNESQTTAIEDTLDIKFECTFCSKSFTTNEHLTAHYKTHSKVDCPYCAMIVSENELVEHLKKNHEHHNFFLCEPCNVPYYTEKDLMVHMKNNHPREHAKLKKKCILCLETVIPRYCKNHTCRFGCPDCSEVPCVHYKYLISFKEQSLRQIRKVKCLDCEYVCQNKLNLVSHVNREHLNHHPYICDKCGEQFPCKISLRRHIFKFHQELFICEFCDKEFRDLRKCECHKETCQLMERVFVCKECPATFISEHKLNVHKKQRHSVKVASCGMCNKQFVHERRRKLHMVKVHSGLQFKKKKIDNPV